MIKIADVLEEYTYKEGQCIIRQVTMKDKIYQNRQQNTNKKKQKYTHKKHLQGGPVHHQTGDHILWKHENLKILVEKKFFDQMIFLGSYWRHILHHQRRPSKGETEIDLI